ncbi:DUF333 domain-containing protein [Acetobacter estunensis]|uniref:putative hemolysin n=1 Tax=Acetobacter estunensis TaxID=104097 RepID=UPI001C2DDD7A|nr:DUF333 domain-containing protein [Acetobacter estunensis]MBV1837501.1 DUF333 domain-containing protein [Acetobacter estunensis]
MSLPSISLRHILFITGGSLLLAGCASASHPPHRIGMPNPASTWCIKQGGHLEIRKESGGSVGYCHLPDGQVVEEWTLFRAAHPSGGAPR